MDYFHHYIMARYYNDMIKSLDRAIFLQRTKRKSNGISDFERKLRLRQIKAEEELNFHNSMFDRIYSPDYHGELKDVDKDYINSYVNQFKTTKSEFEKSLD